VSDSVFRCLSFRWSVAQGSLVCIVGNLRTYLSNSCRDEQNDKFLDCFFCKQLLRSLFDRYSLIDPTTRLNDRSDTLHTNKNLQNIPTDTSELPLFFLNLLVRRKQLLHATFDRHKLNLTHYTLLQSHLHTLYKQKLAKLSS